MRYYRHMSPAKKPAPWKPGGASLFNRVLGVPYTPGANRLSGKGSPAGVFKKGPFRGR